MGVINKLVKFFWSTDVNQGGQLDVNQDVLERVAKQDTRIDRIERMAYRKRAKGYEPYISDDNHTDDDITVNDIMGNK